MFQKMNNIILRRAVLKNKVLLYPPENKGHLLQEVNFFANWSRKYGVWHIVMLVLTSMCFCNYPSSFCPWLKTAKAPFWHFFACSLQVDWAGFFSGILFHQNDNPWLPLIKKKGEFLPQFLQTNMIDYYASKSKKKKRSKKLIDKCY